MRGLRARLERLAAAEPSGWAVGIVESTDDGDLADDTPVLAPGRGPEKPSRTITLAEFRWRYPRGLIRRYIIDGGLDAV